MEFWIKWLAAFMIVLSILTICIALQEWREWRKNPPDRLDRR
ncbi:hypothetical protein ACE10X_13265 [Bradyrhizobium sp. Pha-3]